MNEITKAGENAVHEFNGALNPLLTYLKSFLTWNNLFKLIGILFVLLIMTIIYKLILRAVKKVSEEKLPPQRALIIRKIISYIFYIIIVMFVLSLFGVKLSAIWGAAGVAGVAIAFAAQTSVSNMISGIFVVAEKVLKIGDLINVAGETGIVDDVGLLSVKIHTLDNQMIRIPNSTIINSTLRNTNYFSMRRMDFQVLVAYDTDMEKALSCLSEAPKYCKSVLTDPAPLVWFEGFDDSGIKMILAIWFKPENFLAAKNEGFIAIKRICDEAGIEIPYNKLDVKVYDGDPQFIKKSIDHKKQEA
ncbi:MAG: mechanosensitive ion channel family protein [Spirochaetales bacterium]|nr:mechanosensitive ion channel family protein [Spirochaetales bacterium]